MNVKLKYIAGTIYEVQVKNCSYFFWSNNTLIGFRFANALWLVEQIYKGFDKQIRSLIERRDTVIYVTPEQLEKVVEDYESI